MIKFVKNLSNKVVDDAKIDEMKKDIREKIKIELNKLFFSDSGLCDHLAKTLKLQKIDIQSALLTFNDNLRYEIEGEFSENLDDNFVIFSSKKYKNYYIFNLTENDRELTKEIHNELVHLGWTYDKYNEYRPGWKYKIVGLNPTSKEDIITKAEKVLDEFGIQHSRVYDQSNLPVFGGL